MSGAGSKRAVRDVNRRVMDQATRQRRARKALESLEQDNFHDDPHADLVMSKKALSLFQDHPEEERKAKRKSRTTEYYKQRFRKNFPQLLEEDAVQNPNPPNYLSAQTLNSLQPARHFCAVCGFSSKYVCVVCGTRYCSRRCQETHEETRCLKWTA
ncbi:hypothetical protein TCAL_08116 [Tigriopus californicus]|uniref:HIT-type domain-containing protein n=1 Tax=Tigriopus californicus TaxID=6832 RepID=A0A553PJN4_TIGCA|nr:zinc finger HIT domain-containing protein 1-like [Tigriopus californicus]TRY77901.1 hypothetical protein TCAL_08116 [Tigriopus californicus]|eukprot:TCALIF_08116-PA protein Name:"Similar to Znhit1 Zinc finger HIT domain-containing protein 1 (Mus musculus)" AED:0.41 eAED:0.41 QI:0/-1/0/1/-1/1/1/0/155